MERASPGVQRAVDAAQNWVQRLGASQIRPLDLVLGLLEEEEGRPAMLVARFGLGLEELRSRLIQASTAGDPAAPPLDELSRMASSWSLFQRGEATFTTDAFLLAVLRSEACFASIASRQGLDAARLEVEMLGQSQPSTVAEPEPPPFLPQFESDHGQAARAIDANSNRAREATRVLEDYCRFALDDRYLTQFVKQLRHDLAEATQSFPPALLLSARDTRGDVGTTVSAGNEYVRSSAAQVATVNLKRLQEALRSLEEFGKIFSAHLGRTFEAIRYRVYTLEQALVLGARSRERLASARLYLLLGSAGCSAALDWTIAQAATGGVQIVQLREKSLEDRALLARARDVRRWTREAGVLFIVNDRPDIAKLTEADGVHLGQDDMSVADARRILGPDRLIGVSTHTIEHVRAAVRDGADYLGLGPTFPSRTKSFTHFPGLDFLRVAHQETSLPAFALGGIGPENLEEVVATGVHRVAVSATLAQSDDPEQIARLMRAILDR